MSHGLQDVSLIGAPWEARKSRSLHQCLLLTKQWDAMTIQASGPTKECLGASLPTRQPVERLDRSTTKSSEQPHTTRTSSNKTATPLALPLRPQASGELTHLTYCYRNICYGIRAGSYSYSASRYSYSIGASDTVSARWINRVNIETIRFNSDLPRDTFPRPWHDK